MGIDDTIRNGNGKEWKSNGHMIDDVT